MGWVRALLVCAHFVCPLLFFTDLTRNPYVTQIALLSICILVAAAGSLAAEGLGGQAPPGVCPAGEPADAPAWSFGRTALDLPLAVWLAVWLASWTWSYFGHAAFYREAMRSEGLRTFSFGATNCLVAYFLAVRHGGAISEDSQAPAGGWAAFCLVWGALWLFFPQLRTATPPLGPLWSHLWDPFGGLLWIGGFLVVLWLARGGSVHDYWHVALGVAFLASAYGIAQYFSFEPVWPRVLNPYGGRSVSTFGNPNFMSSYLVMTLPLAAAYTLTARDRLHRAVYAAVFLVMEAGLMCTLTRSSWVGALAALAPLALSGRLRRLARKDLESTGFVLIAAVAIALLWPQSNVGGYKASVIGRLAEMADVYKQPPGVYSPWYQRLLIWTCSWTMGAESPLLGNGYGLFELFYPFYQGVFLGRWPHFVGLRTHANDSHNEILEVWAQLGLLGLGVFFWIWTTFFRTAWSGAREAPPAPVVEAPPSKGKGRKEAREEPADGQRVWLLAGAAGILGMLVDNLFNVSLHFAVPGFFFWWQAGILMGALACSQGWRRTLRFPHRHVAIVACAAVAGLAAWGCWQSVRFWEREAHYFAGFKLMRGPDPKRAIPELELAYRWHPREVNNNYELGNAYVRAEQLDKAIWAYREALNANAGYDEIYFNMATVLRAMGRRDEAETDFRMSRAINPLNRALYVSYAQFLLEGRRPASGTDPLGDLLESAVHFFPEDLQFLTNLGLYYDARKEPAKAAEAFAKALRLKPELAQAERGLRAALASARGPEPEVLAHVSDFRKLEARLQAKVYDDESLRLARLSAERFPSSAASRLYLANLLLLRGDAAGAQPLYRSVLEAEPNNVPALLNLGQSLKRLGRPQEAAEQFRRALALDPANAVARQELGRP